MPIQHKWVFQKAEGAFLKEEFLEAYLIQAVLIESVAKDLVRFKLPKHAFEYDGLKDRFEKISLNEAVDYLAIFHLVKPDIHRRLKSYNRLRNKIFHEVLNVENEAELKDQLRAAYEEGRKLHDFLLKNIVRILKVKGRQ